MKEAKLTGNLSNTILFKCIRVEGGEGVRIFTRYTIQATTTNLLSMSMAVIILVSVLCFSCFHLQPVIHLHWLQEQCARHQPQLVIHLQPLSLSDVISCMLYKNLPSADYNHVLMDWIGRKEDGRSELCSPERLRYRGATSQSRDSTLARVTRISISYEFE